MWFKKYNYIFNNNSYISVSANIFETEKPIEIVNYLEEIKKCHEEYINKLILTSDEYNNNNENLALVYYLNSLFDVNYKIFDKFTDYNQCTFFKDIVNDKEVNVSNIDQLLLTDINNYINFRYNNENNLKIRNKMLLLNSIFPLFSIIEIIECHNYELNRLDELFKHFYTYKNSGNRNSNMSYNNNLDNKSNLSQQTDFSAFFNVYLKDKNNNFANIVDKLNKNDTSILNIYDSNSINDYNPFWLSKYFIDNLKISPFILFQVYWSIIKKLIKDEKFNQISYFLVVTAYIIYRMLINVELYYRANNNSSELDNNMNYSYFKDYKNAILL